MELSSWNGFCISSFIGSHYDIKKTQSVVLRSEREKYRAVNDFLPNPDDWPTKILTVKQFFRLWMMLPDYYQVRIPWQIYSSYNDGFWLKTLYQNWKLYEDQTTSKWMILIIKTTIGDIFGAFLDTVIIKTIKTYSGSSESFLFQFIEDKRDKYISQKTNNQYFVGGHDYLQIGGGGDGPAIYLKNSLQEGHTNASETFGNKILTSNDDPFFSVASIEVILV